MNKYIVKYEDNYADEFDINKISLITEEERVLFNKIINIDIFTRFNQFDYGIDDVKMTEEEYEETLKYMKKNEYSEEDISNFKEARQFYLNNKEILDKMSNFHFCYCFGTNEDITYEGMEGIGELLEKIEITLATEEEINILKKFNCIEDYGIIHQLIER